MHSCADVARCWCSSFIWPPEHKCVSCLTRFEDLKRTLVFLRARGSGFQEYWNVQLLCDGPVNSARSEDFSADVLSRSKLATPWC